MQNLSLIKNFGNILKNIILNRFLKLLTIWLSKINQIYILMFQPDILKKLRWLMNLYVFVGGNLNFV